MELAMASRKSSGTTSKPRKFRAWLRRTMQRLKGNALPPESWERHLSPVEQSAAQRRIADLIDNIAEKRR
jgi:hypothetical protein